MAITNAQQYQQLVNKPADGKRPGYRGPGGYQGSDSKTGKGGASKGPSNKSPSSNTGNPFSNQGSGDDNRQTYSAIQTQTGAVKGGGTRKGPPGSDMYETGYVTGDEGRAARDDFIRGVIKNAPPEQKKSFLEKFVTPTQKALYNVFPNNPKNEKAYIRYLQSQGVTIPPDLLKAIEEEDKKLSFEDFQELVAFEPKGITDIETLRGIFTDPTRGPFDKILAKPQTFSEFMLTQRNNPGLFVSGDLGNFMDLPKPKDLVNPKTGELYTNQEWNALKQDIGEDRGLLGGGRENNEPQDPCLGPNPPAYCNVGGDDNDDDTTPPSTGVFANIAPRFAGSIFDFDALRAGAMDGGMIEDTPVGGIMDLESGRQMYFLGKLVKKATRAVKKIAKSPFGKAALFAAPFLMNPAARAGIGSFFGKGSFNPLRMAAAATSDGPMTELSPLGKILSKFGMATGEGGGKLTLGGKIGLGFGLPFFLDAMGVGKDKDKGFDIDEYYRTQGIDINKYRYGNFLAPRFRGTGADGGLMRMGYQEGGDAEPVAKKTMPLIDMDGQEKDYRETGGFVDMGRMERADDVPARLSKNEFVFTADAVRNAGEGDIDKGAEVMYNMMKNLEAGGEVSEESQGLEGAREMFQTSQRLGEVI